MAAFVASYTAVGLCHPVAPLGWHNSAMEWAQVGELWRLHRRNPKFACRIAGNFASDEMVASLGYAVQVLKVPLILVLGHDACGAVDATIKSLKDGTTLPGHIPALVTAIAPAVKAVSEQSGNTLEKAIRQNVIDNVAKLKAAGPILSAAVDQKKLRVVGGIYRLEDGEVEMVA